jgi:hypothetical protein
MIAVESIHRTDGSCFEEQHGWEPIEQGAEMQDDRICTIASGYEFVKNRDQSL